MYLHCAVHATPKQWFKWLSVAELWYNTSFHASLQCSLFKALYGTEPFSGLIPSLRLGDYPDITDMLRER
jgi:hypothetical protein